MRVGNTPLPPGISEMPRWVVTSAGRLVTSSPLKRTVPALGPHQPADALEQGGLAGAVGAEQGDDLARGDVEVDAEEDLHRAVGHVDALAGRGGARRSRRAAAPRAFGRGRSPWPLPLRRLVRRRRSSVGSHGLGVVGVVGHGIVWTGRARPGEQTDLVGGVLGLPLVALVGHEARHEDVAPVGDPAQAAVAEVERSWPRPPGTASSTTSSTTPVRPRAGCRRAHVQRLEEPEQQHAR